jgi:hypothetical protein
MINQPPSMINQPPSMTESQEEGHCFYVRPAVNTALVTAESTTPDTPCALYERFLCAPSFAAALARDHTPE